MSLHRPVEIAPGTEVRGFLIESKLGAGGYGTVYRASRGERLYALKFLRLRDAGHWAQREVDVLMRLEHPNLVSFEGCGFWPDDSHEFFLVIMDYVHGQRMDVWAAQENPDARQVTLKLIEVARALEAVHQEGVVHRDLKEHNIIVRASDGEAVLVDFGVAGATDALRATPGLLPPTTPAYRSPEAWRAFRQSTLEGQVPYRAGPADDLYALGVVLYWLLTDRLPFTEILHEMVDEVLYQVPKPPHQVNPRVPEALSAVCMKLLEKRPEDRYADAAAVAAAGQAVWATADAAWSVPLCSPHATDNVTTEQAGELGAHSDVEVWLRQARHADEQPRRGRPLAPPVPSKVPALPEPQAPPLLPETARGEAPSSSAASRHLLTWPALVLPLTLGAGVISLAVSTPRTSTPSPPFIERKQGARAGFTAASLMASGEVGGKVAPPWKQPEAAAGDFFTFAAEAPAASPAARDNGEPSVKRPQQKQQKQQGAGSLGKALGTGALCLTAACTSGPQVRAEPPSEECPPGAATAMAELGIDEREPFQPTATLVWPLETGRWTPVKEGPTTWWLTRTWNGLPDGTALSGRFLFGERVYGRFTLARAPDGRTWPVCVELWAGASPRGAPTKQGPTADTMTIFSLVQVVPVKSFGK